MKYHALIVSVLAMASAASPSGVEKWSFKFPVGLPSGSFTSGCAPILTSRDSLLLTSSDGVLRSFSAAGKLEWSNADVGFGVCAKVGADGKIYGGGSLGGGPTWRNQIAAVNKDGVLAWTFQTDQDEVSAPSLQNDGTIIFSSGNSLRALTSDGKEKWNTTFSSSPSYANQEKSGKVPPSGKVFVDANQSVYAVSVSNGSAVKLFTFNMSMQSFGTGAALVEHSGLIYAFTGWCYSPQCSRGSIVALDKHGAKKWSLDTALPPSPAVFDSDGVLYSAAVDRSDNLYPSPSTVYALEGDAGHVKWKFTDQVGVTSPLQVGRNGTVYFGAMKLSKPLPSPQRPAEQCSLYALGKDGRMAWSIPTAGVVRMVALGHDGTVYFDTSYSPWCKAPYSYNNATLFAATPEGKLIWQHKVDSELLLSAPVFDKSGVMYLTAARGQAEVVYAVEPPTGHKQQVFNTTFIV